MKKIKNVKRISMKIPAVIMCILSVICFGCGGLYTYFGEGSYKLEKIETITVTSVDDIKNYGMNISNNRVNLANDIHVTDESFCVGDKNREFVGTFDGCGHTVYFDYPIGYISTSFFSSIGEKGVVKNTKFVFKDVAIAENAFSGVAKINYGTMQDCVVEYNLQFNAKDGMFTPFVGVNCGTVKNIVVQGTFRYNPELDMSHLYPEPSDGEGDSELPNGDEVESNPPDTGSDTGLGDDILQENENDSDAVDNEDVENGGNGETDPNDEENNEPPTDITGSQHSAQKNDNEKQIAFGGVCVYNYGELKNSMSSPRFVGFYCTDRDNYLAGRSDNVSIASVCAFSVNDGSTEGAAAESGLVSISEKTLYTSDDARVDRYENFGLLIYDVNGAVTKTVVENTYDFNNTVWEIDETNLCLKLKIK